MLAAHTRPDEKIATLDMFNPFAYALGREPIRGGIAAAAYRYTLDDRHHPSPSRLFADAAVVMAPKFPPRPPYFMTVTERSTSRRWRRSSDSRPNLPGGGYTGEPHGRDAVRFERPDRGLTLMPPATTKTRLSRRPGPQSMESRARL